MNKVLVGVISSLATLGLVGGAGAIALTSPEVKENLNISYGQSDLMGNNVSSNNKKIQELNNELAEKNMLLVEEQDKILLLTTQVEKLSGEELQYKVEIANLKGDNVNLTTEVETLTRNLTTANNKVTTLEARVSSYQTQITNLRNTNTQLNNNLYELRQQNSLLTSDLELVTADAEMYKSELESLQEDYENNVERIQELETLIAEKESTITELQNQKNSLQMTIYDLETDLDGRNQYVLTLQTQIEELNAEKESLNTQITALNNEISSLNSTIADNTNTINDLTMQLADVQTQLNEKAEALVNSQETVTQLNSTISTLETEIAEYQNKLQYYENALENYMIIDYNVSSVSNYIIQDKDSGILAENPVKDGYIFKGWSLSENGTLVDSATTFTEDTTLYAVFQKEPTLDDFYRTGKLANGDYICCDANSSDAYRGVWYYSSADKKAKQIYPNGLLFSYNYLDDDRLLLTDSSYNGGTIVYIISQERVVVVDETTGYLEMHCTSGNILILSNNSTNTVFDMNTEQLISKNSNYNYMLDTFLDLPSGDCLLGGDSFSSALYIYRSSTQKIEDLYRGGKRWISMGVFDSGIALAGNASLAGILKYDDNTKQHTLIENENITGVTSINIINSKYALILSSGVYYRYCVEDDSIVAVDSDTSSQFLLSLSISENEMLFTGKQNYCGLFMYDAEQNTLRTLFNPNDNMAVYGYYKMYDNGNILFHDWSESDRVVYIASTKTAEEYRSNIDYNTYTGETNE